VPVVKWKDPTFFFKKSVRFQLKKSLSIEEGKADRFQEKLKTVDV